MIFSCRWGIMENTIITFFDLFGTAVFAITGAVKGVRMKLDFLGVLVFACTVGSGGGILRDLLIGVTPVTAFTHEIYLIIGITAGVLVFFLANKFIYRWRIIMFCDAIGLGVFTALGMAKAAQAGLGPLGQVLSGVMTAVGGGAIRDVLSHKVPDVLTTDFYATASVLGALAYLGMDYAGLGIFPRFLSTALLVTVLRVLAIKFNLHLPISPSSDSDVP